MKAEILDLAIYIFRTYPSPLQLSKPRLVKIMYLIDWKHCLDFGEQATDINWFFNHYGPYVDDVINTLKNAPNDFIIKSYNNPFGGGMSDSIKLISERKIFISNTVKQVTDLIISKTHHFDWTSFISLVYGTYPVKTSSKYTRLNLVQDASQYKKGHKI